MWWLLVCLISLADCSIPTPQDPPGMERHEYIAEGGVTVTTMPHIHHCRSPNMEDFTCWWHPLGNTSGEDNATYVLTYTKDKGPKLQCPDYVTKGPNSCYFDSGHTSIWKIYCMSVTAVTAHGNYTSQEHCLDVAEIVQTEAPVGLTYKLTDAGGDEMGHNVLLSWTYPVPSDLQFGWITLVYELQYRRLPEPDNWKVKQPQREAHMELQGLPVGDYVVRVRCRSHNYGLWSQWSSALHMTVPATHPTGKLLVLSLFTGIGIVALLMICFSIIPHSKRIKAYFLPPIPKPRIIGIDPLLLKKGCMAEINNHFHSFHGYSPPSYVEEVWDEVGADSCRCPSSPPEGDGLWTGEKAVAAEPCGQPPSSEVPWDAAARLPASLYVAAPPVTLSSPPPPAPGPPPAAPWAWPNVTLLPGTDYSAVGRPAPHDFYTCVLMNNSGEVHLVPCLTPEEASKEAMGKQQQQQQLAEPLARNNTAGTPTDTTDRGKVRNSEVDTPLPLPAALTIRAEQC